MAYFYTFTIKKGKVELEVTSDNQYFILMQFDKMFKEAQLPDKKPKKADKVAEKQTKESEKQQAKAAEKTLEKEPESITKKSVEKTSEKLPEQQELMLDVPVKEETLNVEEAAPIVSDPVEEEATPVIVESEEIIDEIEEQSAQDEPVDPLEDIEVAEIEEVIETEAVIEPEMSEPAEKDPSKDIDEFLFKKKPEQDKSEDTGGFEALLKEKMLEPEEIIEPMPDDILPEEESSEEELVEALKQSFEEEAITPEVPEIKRASEPESEKQEKSSKVYDILQEKLASIPDEDKNRLNLARKNAEQESKGLKFNTLDDLVYLKKPQTKLDYLLLTSYFLQEHEDTEKYSLKQINSLVLPHAKGAIDHSVIHEAVAHEYFEVIPDYLGTAGITEYKITNEGVDYILNEL